MNDMTPAGDLRWIPVSELTLSPLNTRKVVADEEINAMADSIAQSGLLQNLIGLDRDGTVEIVGGGKRLRALQRLADEGFIAGNETGGVRVVPVKVTSDEAQAIAWSGTENAARTELHPADEIEAYAALRAQGKPVSLIAATFAVSEAHVVRRLRLATLPDPVRIALREGAISIDQARALTVAKDDKACLAMLDVVLQNPMAWQSNPGNIRRELAKQQIPATSSRARFVGLEAYSAAGGATTLDLFEDQTYLHDEALLNRLFAEKAQAETERVRTEEGWAWATFLPDSQFDYDAKELEKIEPVQGDLPEGDLAEYDELAEIGEDGLTEEGLARLTELQARLDGEFTDEQRAIAGIICRVDFSGRFKVHRAFVRKADVAAAQNDGDASDEGGASLAAAPEPEKIPQNLRDDLHAIALRAVQTKLFDKFELLLDLFGFSLGAEFGYDRPLSVVAEAQTAAPERADGLTEDARFDRPVLSRTNDAAEAFAAFRAKGRAHRNRAIALALARAFKRSPASMFALIASEVQPDVRAIWTPTASNFLGRMPTAYLDRLWSELVGDLSELDFLPLKKAEKAKHLERLFNDLSYREALGLSRAQNAVVDAWLPEELRLVVAPTWSSSDDTATTEEEAA